MVLLPSTTQVVFCYIMLYIAVVLRLLNAWCKPQWRKTFTLFDIQNFPDVQVLTDDCSRELLRRLRRLRFPRLKFNYRNEELGPDVQGQGNDGEQGAPAVKAYVASVSRGRHFPADFSKSFFPPCPHCQLRNRSSSQRRSRTRSSWVCLLRALFISHEWTLPIDKLLPKLGNIDLRPSSSGVISKPCSLWRSGCKCLNYFSLCMEWTGVRLKKTLGNTSATPLCSFTRL